MTEQTDIHEHPLILELRKFVADTDLLARIDYLIAENQVYRTKFGKRVPLTDSDRRSLIRAALPVKFVLAELATIVKPATILRWHREMKRRKWDYSGRKASRGRPRISEDIKVLAIRMAEENAWGCRRIVGELKKLGHTVSHETVRNILRNEGMPTSPNRTGMSWKQFIQSHISTAWACDFFTDEVWTKAGLTTCYILFFLHLGTRRVNVVNVTTSPGTAWIKQQARNFLMHLDDLPQDCTHLIHDRDCCFLPMDPIIQSADIKLVKTPPASPWLNGHAERFVREARETLDNLILVGERQLYRAMKAIERHHNEQRPHQGINNIVPIAFKYPEKPIPAHNVVCRDNLGGLLNHYERRAA